MSSCAERNSCKSFVIISEKKVLTDFPLRFGINIGLAGGFLLDFERELNGFLQ